jgi:hypothetical protein
VFWFFDYYYYFDRFNSFLSSITAINPRSISLHIQFFTIHTHGPRPFYFFLFLPGGRARPSWLASCPGRICSISLMFLGEEERGRDRALFALGAGRLFCNLLDVRCDCNHLGRSHRVPDRIDLNTNLYPKFKFI